MHLFFFLPCASAVISFSYCVAVLCLWNCLLSAVDVFKLTGLGTGLPWKKIEVQYNLVLVQYASKFLIIMASLLALSILWMSYQPYSLAWSPVPPVAVRTVATRASSKCINRRRLQTHHPSSLPSTSCTHHNHNVPTLSLALSNLETDITLLQESEDELQQLTVPELKEKLRSNGQKVCLLVCLFVLWLPLQYHVI